MYLTPAIHMQKPITHTCYQFANTQAARTELEKMLADTDAVGINGLRQRSGTTFMEYEPKEDAELGKRVPIWRDDWVVVSSLGEVRVLTNKQFRREFYTYGD